MEPDDELTADAPLVPHLGTAPDRTDTDRIEIDALRREIRALRARLDTVEAALEDRQTDDPTE